MSTIRGSYSYRSDNIEEFKQKLLHWSQQFDDVVWLESNDYNHMYSSYDAILAGDALTSIQSDYVEAFDKLKEYQTLCEDWIFGYLSYDLKNNVEDLSSNNFDGLHFPDLYFFQPKRLFLIKGNEVEVQYLQMAADEMEDDLLAIKSIEQPAYVGDKDIKIKMRIHKDEYFTKVNDVLNHIHRGDIYEANFCQEFYAENTVIDPLFCYKNLNNISKPPFASYLKLYDKFLISASPERYIKKNNNKIISQPIKGTAKRSANILEDEQLKVELKNNQKERSENIMIVDLVRNDLSKVAQKNTVKVEELCEVYSFEQVHQLISTVSAVSRSEIHPVEIIRATFPMGSMTGAPKISAMKIIEALEETKRGLYSGALGYFSPAGDFDFNVVIRSILYNETKQYVSYSVGGAITANSDPLKEYEECLIKAKAMREVLEN